MIEVTYRAPGRLRLKPDESNLDVDALRMEIQNNALSSSTKVRRSRDNVILLFDPKDEIEIIRSILRLGHDINIPEGRQRTLVRGNLHSKARHFVRRIDAKLRDLSDNEVDLSTVVAIVCAGLGLIQISRGKLLPSGLVLFLHSSRFMEDD